MPRHYLQRLIGEGEHQHQDFKYKVTDACKLAKSVSAFANTEGGRLLIGVRDDGHLSGVRSEEEIFMMQSAATDYCHPSVAVNFDTFSAGGRTIVIATIPSSLRKPIRALCDDGKWRAYIRIADENIVASPVHLRLWHDSQKPMGLLVNIGREEADVMRAMENSAGMTLQQVVKKSHVNYHHAIVILAKLIHFKLANCQLNDHRFLFSLV